MASTFSELKFELIGTGDQAGNWGETTNDNIGTAIEQAITGLGNPVFTTDADLTISLTDTVALQTARALVLNMTSTGSLTALRNLVVPTIEKQYIVQNNTTGGRSITVKTVAGTGITVPNGAKMHLYVDGVNVVDAVSHFTSLTLGTPLGISEGGTGQATRQEAMDALAGSTTSGQYLRGNGTDVVMSAIQAADVPTLNQNTTGTAANVTGIVAVANGGTGTATPSLVAGTNITISGSFPNQTINASGGGGSGDVTGPASATNNGIALFDGTTGKIIKDAVAQDGFIHGARAGRGAGGIAGNTAFGASALNSNTTGSLNTAVGVQALNLNTIGVENTAVGNIALQNNTTGSSNTAVGYRSLNFNITGSSNTAVGDTALYANTGSSNTAVGNFALANNSSGAENTAVGNQAMNDSSTGGSNVGIGSIALRSNTTGGSNTAVGSSALRANTIGSSNTAVGQGALDASTTVSELTAVGASALRTNTTGTLNTAVGFEALRLNTIGASNTGVGYKALRANTTGFQNTAMGSGALQLTTTGTNNTAVGFNALQLNTVGTSNTAVGASSLDANTTGTGNTAVGNQALGANTVGGSNTAVGNNALVSNTDGTSNVAVGSSALFFNSTGINSTAVGASALGAHTTGNSNTAVGTSALNTTTTGANNTGIGNGAVAVSATTSNSITLGNSSIASLRCQVTTITSLSDVRDKTNIVDIPAGLSFVQALRPVSFDWNMRDGAKIGVREFGFIAQELQEAQATTGITVPNLVMDENPEKIEASVGTLLPILVKAIQELKAEFDAYKMSHP